MYILDFFSVVSDEKIEESTPSKVLLRPSALTSHTAHFGKSQSGNVPNIQNIHSVGLA